MWFERLLLRRALKRLALNLPGQLREGWGGSKTYTPGQIRAALNRLSVKPALRPFGFASFMEQADYERLDDPVERSRPYLDARRVFFGAIPASHPGTYAFQSTDDFSPPTVPPSDHF